MSFRSFKPTIIAAGTVFAFHADAAVQAECVNPGLCTAIICVANPINVRAACQRACGFNATVRSVRTSNCSPQYRVQKLRKRRHVR